MRLDELDFRNLAADLPHLSFANRLALIFGVWLLLGLGSFLVFWKGDIEANTRLDAEIREALTRLDAQSLLLLEAPAIEAKLADLEAQLPILTSALPTEKELASLLGRINDMILQQDLNLSEFIPQDSVDKEVMRVVPVKLRVRGLGPEIAKLPNMIAKLSRQVSLKEFEMSVLSDSASWQLSGELNAFAQLRVNAADATLNNVDAAGGNPQ